MDFTKIERDDILKVLQRATFMFALYSEPDQYEDETSQPIRKELDGYARQLFEIREKVEKLFDNYKTEFIWQEC